MVSEPNSFSMLGHPFLQTSRTSCSIRRERGVSGSLTSIGDVSFLLLIKVMGYSSYCQLVLRWNPMILYHGIRVKLILDVGPPVFTNFTHQLFNPGREWGVLESLTSIEDVFFVLLIKVMGYSSYCQLVLRWNSKIL